MPIPDLLLNVSADAYAILAFGPQGHALEAQNGHVDAPHGRLARTNIDLDLTKRDTDVPNVELDGNKY